jgi:hypothetical protein
MRISVSPADRYRPSLVGGMVARNPDNHDDLWYIAPEFFHKNYFAEPPVCAEFFPDEPPVSRTKADIEATANLPNWHVDKAVPSCQCVGCERLTSPPSACLRYVAINPEHECGIEANPAPSAPPARCGFFGEGRGQCMLHEGHRAIYHTCQQDGRLLACARAERDGLRELVPPNSPPPISEATPATQDALVDDLVVQTPESV